ncbi:hypothetical protein C8R47DRAFT_1180717 [Mycena vitilis]|nr:hypothetical protein C8R47DRAFT_1180717 [Mycena vitilis]
MIISVSLYSTRAEITRLYKFAVQTGQNQVSISNLPNVLEAEFLRLEELANTRKTTANALARCEEALASVKQYLGSITVQNLAVAQLDSVLEQYESTAARLDARKVELTRELQRIDAATATEQAQLTVPPEHNKLRNRAAIGVFARNAGDVEIALIYAVPFASWTAFYDIRVDMDTKEIPVKLIYKAAVKQNTGESWDNVPLQLETSTPTFGLGVPTLYPWNVDIYRVPSQPHVLYQCPTLYQASLDVDPAAKRAASLRRPVMSWYSTTPGQDEDDVEDGFIDSTSAIKHADAAVTSAGNVSATFRVPGLATIPCDNAPHNFAIVELHSKATMSWVAVPKREAKTHLTYTLLSGTASVYVGGSFIARSSVPAVSPQESFYFPLGPDPSIRITYHPCIKKRSQSGFYNKSEIHSAPIEGLRIVDQIPASQNAQIKGVNVAARVVAQWDGGEERDRRVSWVCTVPARGKVYLAMEWTVTVSPADVRVIGL